MRRIYTFIVTLAASLAFASAQPSIVKNALKSTFKLTAYDADGNSLATSYGVFVDNDGTAIGTWTTLANADHATATDCNGIEHEVKSICGVNELYDVCKFKVKAQRTTAATLPTADLPKGSKLWLLDADGQKVLPTQFDIEREETFMDKYKYYVFAINQQSGKPGFPFVNNAGQVIALLHPNKASLFAQAVDARFIKSLGAEALAVNSSLYSKTNIRIDLPGNKKDALLMLMLAVDQNNKPKYMGYTEDFISKFPHEIDGYSANALENVAAGNFQKADETMTTALRQVSNKAEAHAEYARIMYQKLAYSNDTTYTNWTFDKALQEAQKAYSIDAQPTYKHRMAQIMFAKGNYSEACQTFEELTRTMPNSEVFFETAQCKNQLGAPKEAIIALLDSAVAQCQKPYTNVAAPYLLARAQAYDSNSEYRKALTDYNAYDTLVYGRGSAEFYYTKYKCELNIRQYQQALNDIAHAAYLAPGNQYYLAELASLQLRVNQYDDAVKASDLCLAIDPESTDALIIKGLALVMKKDKAAGMECLEKAKQLGDERAQSLIDKYK